jgi:hypothetical protein
VSTIEPMMDIVNVSPLAAMPAAATQPAHLVPEFETVFVETLFQHAGLAKALDTQEGSQSGLFGELMLRELARGLAGQLHLGLGAALGVSAIDRR